MAAVSEIQSLDEISYKSKIKIYLLPLIVVFLFTVAFLNFFPIGDKFKAFLKTNLRGSGCNPDYDSIQIEWLMPKLVVNNLSLSPGCLGRGAKAPLNFNFVKVNFNLINFSPLGLPFRIDTEVNAQPLSFYFVQGFGERMLRLKDQEIVLARLNPLLGGNFKLAGNLTVDLNLLLTNQNILKNFSLKAQSKNFQIPSQSVQGFTLPNMKINDFFIEGLADAPPRILVDNLIVGDTDSPVRAKFKGRIDLQQEAIQFSRLDLTGEVAFSENFKQTLPILDMMFQSFTNKDGFYQIRLGGTLGAPKPSSP